MTTVCSAAIGLLALVPAGEAKRKSRGKGEGAPDRRTLAIRVAPEKAGRTVPPSFVGLSIEHFDLPDYTGTASSPNIIFTRLMQTLGGFGNGAPTIRIGGNSSDQSWWNPARVPRPAGILYDIAPGWVAGLGATAAQTRAPVVAGVNLGLNDPTNALEFGDALVRGLPPGSLKTLEIGNEPDLFTKPRTFHVGDRLLQRPRHRGDYSFNAYTQDLDRYITAMRPMGIPLAAGGFAGRGWEAKSRILLGRTKGRISELSMHAYPLQGCGHARRRSPKKLIPRMLAASRRVVRRVARESRLSRRQGVNLRVSETNSAVCGGIRRVSDSFGSALWGADVLFAYLKSGAIGANFHTWTGAWYSPIQFGFSKGTRIAHVKPLFYGMLLFAKATANQAHMVRVHWRGHTRVHVWATRDARGTVRVVMLNLNRQVTRKVRLRVPGVKGKAVLERLTARTMFARTGVRLAGRSYGRGTTSGFMTGKLSKPGLPSSRGVHVLELPGASAALVTLK